MGEETTRFASRFSSALTLLQQLEGDDTLTELRRIHGGGLVGAVRDALDAVAALHETGTKALRDWPEQCQLVLAQVAVLRAALDRAGVDEEARRMARVLVSRVEHRPGGRSSRKARPRARTPRRHRREPAAPLDRWRRR